MMRTFEWRIVLGLALVFLAGVATGLFAGAWHAHRAFGDRHGPMMAPRVKPARANAPSAVCSDEVMLLESACCP